MLNSLEMGYRLAVALGSDVARVVVRTMENGRILLSIRLDDGVWGFHLTWEEAVLVLDEVEQQAPLESGLAPFLEQACKRCRSSLYCGAVSPPDGKKYTRPLEELVKSARRTNDAEKDRVSAVPSCVPA